MAVRFLIIGGGPAGNTAATYAARLGAEVVMVERDIVGGAAHLLDCIPSKTMIATGGAIVASQRLDTMGLENQEAEVDVQALNDRVRGITDHLSESTSTLLESQGVRIVRGSASFVSANEARIERSDGKTENYKFDAALIATGSRPRIPDWVSPDGERILTTRDCYPPKVFPKSVCIVGSGVTGVEFVHMFESFGAKVTLVVSRQQVLPGKDPEVAAVLGVVLGLAEEDDEFGVAEVADALGAVPVAAAVVLVTAAGVDAAAVPASGEGESLGVTASRSTESMNKDTAPAEAGQARSWWPPWADRFPSS